MRRILFVLIGVLFFYWVESLSFYLFGKFFTPHFLLLFVIFVDLYLGIRYGLFTAVVGGILKDSMSVGFFGMHTFSYILCAYLAVFIERYLHRSGTIAQLLIVFFVCLANILINSMIQLMSESFSLMEVFKFILLPQVIATLIVSIYTFQKLRRCARKLFA